MSLPEDWAKSGGRDTVTVFLRVALPAAAGAE